MCKKWFFTVSLSTLPIAWFYIHLAHNEEWYVLFIGGFGLFLAYVFCLQAVHRLVHGVSPTSRIQKTLDKRKRVILWSILVATLISIVVFAIVPLSRLDSTLSPSNLKYTVQISVFNLIATLVVGLYLLSEFSKIGQQRSYEKPESSSKVVRRRSKHVRFIIYGLLWPFLVVIPLIVVDVHITHLPDETFWFLAFPLMSLGLIAIGIGIYHLLSDRLSRITRLVMSCFLSFLLGLGDFCLIFIFVVWFHFAIGGSI